MQRRGRLPKRALHGGQSYLISLLFLTGGSALNGRKGEEEEVLRYYLASKNAPMHSTVLYSVAFEIGALLKLRLLGSSG